MAVLGFCVPDLVQGALLAHWAVKYFNNEGKAVTHDKADYVHGFLKILSNKADPVLARSGSNGFLQFRRAVHISLMQILLSFTCQVLICQSCWRKHRRQWVCSALPSTDA